MSEEIKFLKGTIMITEFSTENGSVYRVDDVNSTFEKVSGVFNLENGYFEYISQVVVGRPVVASKTLLDDHPELVITSPVVGFREIRN